VQPRSKSNAKGPLFSFVGSFFLDHLKRLLGASKHTVRAYRDTLRLLFIYLAARKGCDVAGLQLTDLNFDGITGFLNQLETERANSVTTRNCRLATIRSFFKHLIRQDLDHAAQYQRVLALPAKKAKQTLATYFEAEEVNLILRQPDKRTALGQRDHALLLFLYNTGARVSEALAVRNLDLYLTAPLQSLLNDQFTNEKGGT
jgi:site-specific recombinase XerD